MHHCPDCESHCTCTDGEDDSYKCQHCVKPEVGMGVTGGAGSDCYPYTVIEVNSDKDIVIQSDNFRRTDKNGLSESQEYDITPNPNGVKIRITLRNDNRWVERGQDKNRSGYTLNVRRAYQDPSF